MNGTTETVEAPIIGRLRAAREAAAVMVERKNRVGLMRVLELALENSRDTWEMAAARTAIWHVAAPWLTGAAADAADMDVVNAALRRLANAGHPRCPTCRRVIPDHATIDSWEAGSRRVMVEALT